MHDLIPCRPAASLNLEALLAETISATTRSDRMNEPTDVTQAIFRFATTAMEPGLQALALHMRSAKTLTLDDGWLIELMETTTFRRTDLLLRHPGQDSGFHFFVDQEPELTPEAKAADRARYSGLDRAAVAALIIKSLRQGHEENNDFKAHLHLPLSVNDRVDRIGGTRLPLVPRPPNDIGPRVVKTIAGLDLDGGIWWKDILFEVHPARTYRPYLDDSLTFDTQGRPSEVHLGLDLFVLIGRAIRAIGATTAVRNRNAEIGRQIWEQYGDTRHAMLCELGAAAVWREGGFVTQAAIDTCAALSFAIAGQDLARSWDIAQTLARDLLAHTHITRQTAYECNDLDNHAWVEDAEAGLVLHFDDQHGTFRIDIRGEGPRPVLRIHRVDGGEVYLGTYHPSGENYVLAAEDRALVPYRTQTVRSFNTVIYALHSISVCFEEDHK